MADFVIQTLCGDDVGRMRQVNRLFAEAFDDMERYRAAPSDDHLRRLLASEHFVVLAAIREDQVIGALTAYELVKYERETRELYLYDIAVADPFRRRGVATALIDGLRRLAERRGADTIFVQADGDDEQAIALYERFAERRQLCHFDIASVT